MHSPGAGRPCQDGGRAPAQVEELSEQPQIRHEKPRADEHEQAGERGIHAVIFTVPIADRNIAGGATYALPPTSTRSRLATSRCV